jgi:hypothetical protein
MVLDDVFTVITVLMEDRQSLIFKRKQGIETKERLFFYNGIVY